ncbi:MAG: hypothetical protein Kow0092_24000 [Deferrisomatales bacterium]
MNARRTERWEAGDFARWFRQAAHCTRNETTREKLEALARELEPLDREFIRESARCGGELSDTVKHLGAVADRVGACMRGDLETSECHALWHDMDEVIGEVRSMRSACFV